jgi:cytochrome c-type biogenesis protein CcmH
MAARVPWWRGRFGWVLIAAVALGLFVAGGLSDGPAKTQQERVDEIARTVKCPVCAGESVAQSRNPTALAIRNEINEQLRDGRTAEEIRADLASRFGEDIDLVPPSEGLGSLVWALPVMAAVLAVAGLVVVFRRWRREQRTTRGPTDEDRALVAAALDQEQGST